MNADGLCQIPLTARNAELASVPGQSDIYIYIVYTVYISAFQLKLFSFIQVFASPERNCVQALRHYQPRITFGCWCA